MTEEITAGLMQQAGLGGWAAVVGSLGLLVTFGTRVFKAAFPSKWERLSFMARVAIPIAATAIGTLVIGIAGAMATGVALSSVIGKLVIAAVAAAVTSIGTHKVTKKAGQTFDAMSLKRDPNHKPGVFRKAMSLAVPLSRDLVPPK